MKSSLRFMLVGVRQAVWILGTLILVLLLIGVGLVSLPRTNSVSADLRNFASWLLLGIEVWVTGPEPYFLTFFDLSDRALFSLSAALLLPYWCSLGALSGWLYWRLAPHDATASGNVSKRILWQICLLAGGVALAVAVLTYPLNITRSFVRSGTSFRYKVINNLRQIDSAKQLLAIERKLPSEYVPAEAELKPYLDQMRVKTRIGPERYVIGSIKELPYAVVDSDSRIRRHGWSEGYTIPKQIIRLN